MIPYHTHAQSWSIIEICLIIFLIVEFLYSRSSIATNSACVIIMYNINIVPCIKQLTENYTDTIYCGILHAPTKLIINYYSDETLAIIFI